jgi:hypothetical protein
MLRIGHVSLRLPLPVLAGGTRDDPGASGLCVVATDPMCDSDIDKLGNEGACFPMGWRGTHIRHKWKGRRLGRDPCWSCRKAGE